MITSTSPNLCAACHRENYICTFDLSKKDVITGTIECPACGIASSFAVGYDHLEENDLESLMSICLHGAVEFLEGGMKS